MSRPGAVLDLDGTLLPATSAERLFVRHLGEQGLLGRRQLAAFLSVAATLPVRGRTRALRANKRYLTGLEETVILAEAERFVTGVLEARLDAYLLRCVQRLGGRGYVACLLTGAPGFLAEILTRRLGLADGIGTRLEVRNGRFTGRVVGPHYFGEAKKDGVAALARRHGLDLPRSYAFADHHADVHFLGCFGHAVAVDPTRALRKVATARGWRVWERRGGRPRTGALPHVRRARSRSPNDPEAPRGAGGVTACAPRSRPLERRGQFPTAYFVKAPPAQRSEFGPSAA